MASKNYTDESTITINDINDPPIEIANKTQTGNWTAADVFGAINKVIKAIIARFATLISEVDEKLNSYKEGCYGRWDVADEGENIEKGIKEYSLGKNCTHGVVRVVLGSSSAAYLVGQQTHSCIISGNTTVNNIGVSFLNSNTIRLSFNSAITVPTNGLFVEYELY